MSPVLGGEAIVFIDGPNLAGIVRQQFADQGMSMRYFVEMLKRKEGPGRACTIVRTYYYTVGKKDDKFYTDELYEIPDFEIREGFMSGHNRREKAVDVFLAVDMVKFAYLMSYKLAILVSGDGDYVPAVCAVKERPANVVVVSHEKAISRELRIACDQFSAIDSYITKGIQVAKTQSSV